METLSIKALAIRVLQRNKQGNQKETYSFPDRNLAETGFQVSEPIGGNSETPDCFSPDGILEAAFGEAVVDGWDDGQLLEYVDALRRAGALPIPWGFVVRNSPLVGEPYWILSDDSARGRVPAGAMSFTLEELEPIIEACRIFPGGVLKVLRHQEKGTGNA